MHLMRQLSNPAPEISDLGERLPRDKETRNTNCYNAGD